MEHAQTGITYKKNGLAIHHTWNMLDWNNHAWNIMVDCNRTCKVLYKLEKHVHALCIHALQYSALETVDNVNCV